MGLKMNERRQPRTVQREGRALSLSPPGGEPSEVGAERGKCYLQERSAMLLAVHRHSANILVVAGL